MKNKQARDLIVALRKSELDKRRKSYFLNHRQKLRQVLGGWFSG